MKKVLILGDGYVGRNLFRYTKDTQDVEYQIHSRSTLDYTNISLLNKYIINNDITHVVNCFGFTGRPNVDECESRKEECWKLNVTLPLQISNLCQIRCVSYIHISSGCIYSGYDKQYTEEDKPNFGLFDESSFYSKSKHAFETMNQFGVVIRVRMPFCNELVDRSYLTKILKYDNLIDYTNSKTYIPDLCEFVKYIINNKTHYTSIGTINFVNPGALSTTEVVDLLKDKNKVNPNWKFVDVKDLNLKAPRSNCVLSIDKLQTLFPDFSILTEKEAIEKALSYHTIVA
jgi:dTDP-4-dehydrorhamnose reductase